MTANELFRAGKLGEAIQTLGAELRKNPSDSRRRSFLFELLCFAGDYGRALKQLDVLGQENPQAELGALLYRSAVSAERSRQQSFQSGAFPGPAPPSPAGVLNGKPFESVADADPRIGSRLEVFVAGEYMLLRFEHVASIQMEPPRLLRDLLWIPALVRTGPSFKDKELGEVLLPVMTPLASFDPSDEVKLGRMTEWVDAGQHGPVPIGRKMLLVDGEEFPLLEVRTLEFTEAGAAVS
jgi:type VI secretion system protein ImpE